MPYDNADEEDLSRLNQLRDQIFNWFVPLRTVWEKPDTTVREAMTSLFSFMQQFDIAYKDFWMFPFLSLYNNLI